MVKWIYNGASYYSKKYEEKIQVFFEKMEKIGLDDREIDYFVNMQPLNCFKEFVETSDMICTRCNHLIYVTGFYFLEDRLGNMIRIIMDGKFEKLD